MNPSTAVPGPAGPEMREVRIGPSVAPILGMLRLPPEPRGVVIVAAPCDRRRPCAMTDSVAESCGRAGFGVLRPDLLSEPEDLWHTGPSRTELLGDRLRFITAWLQAEGATRDLPFAIFGAGDGAHAAVDVAAGHAGPFALVLCGGRYDHVRERVARLSAPTLVLVPALDDESHRAGERACTAMTCEKQLFVLPGTRSFEEPAACTEVGRQTARWFTLRV